MLLSLLLLFAGVLEMVGVGIVPVYVTIVAYPEKLIEKDIVQALLAAPGQVITQDLLLYWGSAVFLAFFTFKGLFSIYLTYWQARFVQNRVLRLGDKLFTAYMRVPYSFHLDRNSAQLLRNVNVECTRIGSNVLAPSVQLLTHIFIFLAVTVLLVVASPGFAVLAMFLFVLVAMGVSLVLHKKVKELGLKAQAARGEVVRSVNEGLAGVKEIKILRRENLFITRFRNAFNTNLSVQRFMQVVGKAIPVLMEWLSVAGLLGLVVLMFNTGREPSTVVSTVVLFAVSLMRLKGAMSVIVARYTAVQHNLVSVDEIYGDIRKIEELSSSEKEAERKQVEKRGQDPFELKERIALDKVSFRYTNAHEEALKEVSVEIAKGEALGIVGSTGAGKSTLVDIVLGVLKPTSGTVTVDGIDIQIDMKAWQRLLGYIPQTIYLLDGTIRENIALGLPDSQIDDHVIERVLKAAHLEDFVNGLPDRAETIVGERGVRLSGGQRQRIAIARSLYHDPQILVMDEATSALDNITERSIVKAVDELKGQRTILMIAHRLTTVKNCDRILILNKGRVDAMGTYDELLAEHEGFRRMAEA